MSDSETEIPGDHSDTEGFYTHTRRPNWGIAIMAWEQGDKRAYQFSDGRCRVFKEGFYNLLVEVDPPDDDDLLHSLRENLKKSQDSKIQGKEQKPLEPVCSFDVQIKIIKTLYPDGFRSLVWREEMRGEGAARPIKRHRDPVIRRAQRLLTAERMNSEDPEALFKEIASLLRSTTLAGNKAVKALTDKAPGHEARFVTALNSLLHGEGEYMRRFGAWINTLSAILGEDSDWALATVLPSLMMPDEEVCVGHTAFKKQAGSIAPRLPYTPKANRTSYRNFRKVAHEVSKRLKDEGLEPHDLIDVHDFIEITLKPSMIKKHGG